MKKVKSKFLKSYSAIIVVLLSLLKIATSCDNPQAEYGVPTAKFIVKGKVSSAENSQTISNIRVIMNSDTSYSDANGSYSVSDNWGYPGDQTYTIQFTDIDGLTNGEFKTLDTLVEFKNPKFTNGDGNWFEGETEKEFDVKLEPKK